MPRKDYMMRYFEQLGVVLAALLGFRQKGSYEEALGLIRQTLDELPDYYYELSDLDPERLRKKVTEELSFSLEKIEMIATLMYEEAEFLNLSGDSRKASDRFHKALILLEYVDNQASDFSVERKERINKCKMMET